MNSFFYTYNNEAIVALVISQILEEEKTIDLSRIAIITPILLNDLSIDVLNIGRCRTLKQFLKATSRNQLRYNEYYYGMLPVVINSLKIIVDSDIASFKNGMFQLTENSITKSNISNLGERYNKIHNILPFFLSLVDKYKTHQLYELFRIRL